MSWELLWRYTQGSQNHPQVLLSSLVEKSNPHPATSKFWGLPEKKTAPQAWHGGEGKASKTVQGARVRAAGEGARQHVTGHLGSSLHTVPTVGRRLRHPCGCQPETVGETHGDGECGRWETVIFQLTHQESPRFSCLPFSPLRAPVGHIPPTHSLGGFLPGPSLGPCRLPCRFSPSL